MDGLLEHSSFPFSLGFEHESFGPELTFAEEVHFSHMQWTEETFFIPATEWGKKGRKMRRKRKKDCQSSLTLSPDKWC